MGKRDTKISDQFSPGESISRGGFKRIKKWAADFVLDFHGGLTTVRLEVEPREQEEG